MTKNKELALDVLAMLSYFYPISLNKVQLKYKFDIDSIGLTKVK